MDFAFELKTQGIGVQGRALQDSQWMLLSERRGAVERIAQDGKAEGRGVGADLVRASAFGHGLDQDVGDVSFADLEAGYGRPAFFLVHHCAVTVSHVGAQGGAAGLFLPGRDTDEDGMIHFVDGAGLEKQAQGPVRSGCAGKQNHAAGHFVQAVNNPQFAIFSLGLFKQAGFALFPSTGHRGDASRFVEHQQRVVGIQAMDQWLISLGRHVAI